MKIPIILSLVAVLAGGGVAAASQDSLPGEMFFPVKIATENVRAAIALDAEAKADLRLRFSKKRLEEIKELLENRGLETEGLAKAITRLEENDRRALEIVLEERGRGGNSDDLAVKVNDSLNAVESNLRDLLRAEENTLRNLEDDLKVQIDGLKDRSDETSAEQLKALLREVHARRVMIEAKREGLGDLTDDRHLELRGGLDDNSIAWRRVDAQEAIANAERERADLLSDAARQGLTVSGDQLKAIDELLVQAKALFDQSKFREAKIAAKQSRDLSRELEDRLLDSIVSESSNSGSGRREDDNSGRGNGGDDNVLLQATLGGFEQQRGGEVELRGREAEGEVESRGRASEGETEHRGGELENEIGDDSGRNRGGSDNSGSGSNGSGRSGERED